MEVMDTWGTCHPISHSGGSGAVIKGGSVDNAITYANPWSRLVLKRFFQQQFVLPDRPPKHVELPLKALEKVALRINDSYKSVKLEKPVFIISLPRTGSSMLQNVLCTHPQLAYVSNTMSMVRTAFVGAELARRWLRLDASGERYLSDSVVVDTQTPSDAVALWTDWFNIDPYSIDYVERRFSDFDPLHLSRVYDDMKKIVWLHGGRGNSKRFFTKNPGLLTELTVLKDAFPDGKFIHLIRDPRQNANSMVKLEQLDNKQLNYIREQRGGKLKDERVFVPFPRLPRLKEYVEQWGVEDIRTTANVWNDAATFIEQRKHLVPNFHEVRYEDIVANPSVEIPRIFEFCELDPVGSDNVAYNKLLDGIGRTHHRNSYGNFDLVERICGEHMRRLGYA